MSDSSPRVAGQVSAANPPLDVLAELELVRRKSDLFERRLASWEAGLLELRQRLHVLETARDPESPAWLDALGDLAHRIDRLERRRRRAIAEPMAPVAVAPEPVTVDAAAPAEAIEGARAIVNARWGCDAAHSGDRVELSAEVDGIEAGVTLTLTIHAVSASPPVDQITADCDGDRVSATWKIPDGIGTTELFFTIEHRGTRTRSGLLIIE